MIQRYRFISFELLQTCCVVCDDVMVRFVVVRFFVVPTKPVRRLIGTGSSPFGCCCVRMRQTQNGLDHRPHTRFASMTKNLSFLAIFLPHRTERDAALALYFHSISVIHSSIGSIYHSSPKEITTTTSTSCQLAVPTLQCHLDQNSVGPTLPWIRY